MKICPKTYFAKVWSTFGQMIFLNWQSLEIWSHRTSRPKLFFKWASPGLLCLFLVFSNNQYNFYNKSMWKMSWPSSIRRQYSNPRPLEHESSPITTRPGPRLLATSKHFGLLLVTKAFAAKINCASFTVFQLTMIASRDHLARQRVTFCVECRQPSQFQTWDQCYKTFLGYNCKLDA